MGRSKDVIKELTYNPDENRGNIGRFNKKDFNRLMLALANDVDIEEEVAKIKGESVNLTKILPTKEFRKWCKKLLMQAGMDKDEANKILTEDFQFETMNGLYEFFTYAIYTYMETNHKFDFTNKKDFKGSIYLKDVPEKTVKQRQYSPRNREFLGEYTVVKKKHKELGVKSSCPKYLRSRV